MDWNFKRLTVNHEKNGKEYNPLPAKKILNTVVEND